MNIVFLDVDNVLNCDTSTSHCGQYTGVDNDKIQRLKKIVDETNAIIVLISDWKIGYSPNINECLPHAQYLVKHLKRYGLHISDVTVDERPEFRGAGIKSWLKKVEDLPNINYVILDDCLFDYEREDLAFHLVLCNHKRGLGDIEMKQAIGILKFGKYCILRRKEQYENEEIILWDK